MNENRTAPVECPSDVDLRSFSEGSAEGREQAIAAHLARCGQCATRFRKLDTLTEALSTILAAEDPFAPFADEDGFSSFIARAKATPPSNDPGEMPLQSEVTTQTCPKPDSTTTWGMVETQAAIPPARDRIGDYPVLCVLGSGGFAEVYKAKDPRDGRFVAIKVLRPDKITAAHSAELLEEARTLGNLDHPQIVKVFDWGRAADDACYVVMQYIDGVTLRDRIDSGLLDPSESARIAAQLAEALDYAHQREVYHRDVKPANVLLDLQRGALLSDFGLAIHDRDRWQHEGQFAGTHAYMAPEQVQGSAVQFDGRTDIWSLGVVFYEMLTGRRPFSGNRPQLTAEIQSKHPRHPHALNADIPESLCEICLKCLEKDLSKRYATAGKLAEALSQWRNDQPRDTAIQAAAALKQPTRRWLLAAGAAAAVGGGLGTYMLMQPKPVKSYPKGKWTSVFDEEPEPLVYPQELASSKGFDPRRAHFSVRSKEMSLFATGRASFSSFRLRFAMSIPDRVGFGGMFVGWAKDRDALPPDQHRCLAVHAGRMLPADAPELLVEDFTVTNNREGNRYVSHHAVLQSFPLPDVSFGAAVKLEIAVQRGCLRRIELSDDVVPNIDIQLPLGVDDSRFGVSCMGGYVVFHEMVVMPVSD